MILLVILIDDDGDFALFRFTSNQCFTVSMLLAVLARRKMIDHRALRVRSGPRIVGLQTRVNRRTSTRPDTNCKPADAAGVTERISGIKDCSCRKVYFRDSLHRSNTCLDNCSDFTVTESKTAGSASYPARSCCTPSDLQFLNSQKLVKATCECLNKTTDKFKIMLRSKRLSTRFSRQNPWSKSSDMCLHMSDAQREHPSAVSQQDFKRCARGTKGHPASFGQTQPLSVSTIGKVQHSLCLLQNCENRASSESFNTFSAQVLNM